MSRVNVLTSPDAVKKRWTKGLSAGRWWDVIRGMCHCCLRERGEGHVQKSDDDSNDCRWVSENSDGNGEQGSAHNE